MSDFLCKPIEICWRNPSAVIWGKGTETNMEMTIILFDHKRILVNTHIFGEQSTKHKRRYLAFADW